jgi:hypothetical protein
MTARPGRVAALAEFVEIEVPTSSACSCSANARALERYRGLVSLPQDRYTAKVLAMAPGASPDSQRRLGDSLLEGIASVLVVIGVGVLFGNKLSA